MREISTWYKKLLILRGGANIYSTDYVVYSRYYKTLKTVIFSIKKYYYIVELITSWTERCP